MIAAEELDAEKRLSYQRRPRESHPVSGRAAIRTCAYTDSYSFSAFIMEGFSLPLNVVEVYHSETFRGVRTNIGIGEGMPSIRLFDTGL